MYLGVGLPKTVPQRGCLRVSIVLTGAPFKVGSGAGPSSFKWKVQVGCRLDPRLSISICFVASAATPFFDFKGDFSKLFLLSFM